MINYGIPVIVQDLLKSEKYGLWRLLFKIDLIWSLQVRNPMGSKENGGRIDYGVLVKGYFEKDGFQKKMLDFRQTSVADWVSHTMTSMKNYCRLIAHQ